MTMQVIQIVQELSTVGGVENVAFELAAAFSRANVANMVIASAVERSPSRSTVPMAHSSACVDSSLRSVAATYLRSGRCSSSAACTIFLYSPR